MPDPATGKRARRPQGQAFSEAAPAKINLALHVTGRRADGYHLIDTLAVFADLADTLVAAQAPELSLAVEGPFADALAGGGDNLVLAAARALDAAAFAGAGAGAGAARGARLVLRKELPVAAGIGGGSADAAAALRLLDRLWGLSLGPERLAEIGLGLGADVPMCLHGRALRAQGIGEIVAPVAGLPPLDLVLVNPRLPLSTGPVFARLSRADNDGLGEPPARFEDGAAVAGWLADRRNDLEEPALSLLPVVAEMRAALEAQPGCLLARMSGSGPTTFGLFADGEGAGRAAAAVARAEPGWWVRAVRAR